MLDPFHKSQGTGRLCVLGWVLQEADSGMELSEQNVFWEVAWTMTLMEEREGSRIG